jgi:enamine deaminase RidA (YjgF/YER057c/UK114 family)
MQRGALRTRKRDYPPDRFVRAAANRFADELRGMKENRSRRQGLARAFLADNSTLLEISRYQAGRGFLNFKTGALNHSATLPRFENAWLFGAKRRPNQDFRTALLPNVLALVYCCLQRRQPLPQPRAAYSPPGVNTIHYDRFQGVTKPLLDDLGQVTRGEMIVNSKATKALRVTVPLSLPSRVDKVIERTGANVEVSSGRRQMTDVLGATRIASWVGLCALGLVMWIDVSAGARAQGIPSAEARLKELSIALPPVPPPVANYVDAVRVGNLLFLAGNTPAADWKYKGKLGKDLTVPEGYDTARQVGLIMLAKVRRELGSLDRVKRVVKVLGMVNSAEVFGDQPKVINGFSDLMVEVFGEAIGKHARSAVGMAGLPFNNAVEVEMIVEVAE